MTEFLIGMAAIALFFLAVMAVDCNRFVIREYTCGSSKLKREGCFVLLSDLHGKSFGRNNEKLFRAIEKQNPDAVLIAGDMYTAARGKDNSREADFICRLAKRWPVYYGNGNHEHKTRLYPEEYGNLYEPYMKRLKEGGAVVLVNEQVFLPSLGIAVYGLEIGREYYRKGKETPMEAGYLNRLLGTPDKSRFNLLIAHNPDYFPNYSSWGADLTVSGHVHGGLMRLPALGGVLSPRLRLFPKYDGGYFKSEEGEMILGRGLGTHTLPVRIFNPGELVVIHLRRKEPL